MEIYEADIDAIMAQSQSLGVQKALAIRKFRTGRMDCQPDKIHW
jgi:hypothetical protein